MTTTLKLDWDDNTITWVIQAIAAHVANLPAEGNEAIVTALVQAMVDIESYRAMTEAVKTGDPDNRITDATTLRMAAAVLRRRWRNLVWPQRAAELLDTSADDLHPLP